LISPLVNNQKLLIFKDNVNRYVGVRQYETIIWDWQPSYELLPIFEVIGGLGNDLLIDLHTTIFQNRLRFRARQTGQNCERPINAHPVQGVRNRDLEAFATFIFYKFITH
jgi:hypothetical protein